MSALVDRISVEPSRLCTKGCSFCYNGSSATGTGTWSSADLVAFAADCAAHTVRAISFGGGEPLEWPQIFETLDALRGVLFRSLTTNGLPLESAATFDDLVRARPEKVHVSIHAPENRREVVRVIESVTRIASAGIASGVNLLLRRSRLAEAKSAHAALVELGIGPERIVLLPMRGEGATETPSASEVAAIAAGPFQSMSCLRGCARSARFASIDADRRAAWCSYTVSRRPLLEPTYRGLSAALDALDLVPCHAPKADRARGRLAVIGDG